MVFERKRREFVQLYLLTNFPDWDYKNKRLVSKITLFVQRPFRFFELGDLSHFFDMHAYMKRGGLIKKCSLLEPSKKISEIFWTKNPRYIIGFSKCYFFYFINCTD